MKDAIELFLFMLAGGLASVAIVIVIRVAFGLIAAS